MNQRLFNKSYDLAMLVALSDAEFFRQAILLANGFIKEFGALECSRLSGRKFKDWDEFSGFRNSAACDGLNKLYHLKKKGKRPEGFFQSLVELLKPSPCGYFAGRCIAFPNY